MVGYSEVAPCTLTVHQLKLKSRFSFCERIVIKARDVSCVITLRRLRDGKC